MRPAAVLTGLTLVCVLSLAGSRQADTCALSLRLVDAESGRDLPGLVEITGEDGRPLSPPELLSRGLGLESQPGAAAAIERWSVLAKKTVVTLPQRKLSFAAISGLETETAKTSVDLAGKTAAELTIPLERFYSAASAGYRSANTHLHLMKISRAQSDRYLSEVPRADGLDGLFVSYLERIPDDRNYTSNQYRAGDLKTLGHSAGLVLGNGEEHRHNLAGYGEGYGHVMLLNITDLIQPVSIGPGIMKMGTDGLPLRRGIDTARREGATVIWCHNNLGTEDLPNVVTGRLDAQNIFDGSVRGSYKDTFYRYLNAGFRVPFSTGTDWFMYDFSRAYVDMPGEITVEKWLAGLAAGKSYITNGPLLELHVGSRALGETVDLKEPGRVTVEAQARGRVDFKRIELVQNGKVIERVESHPSGGHFEAVLSRELQITGPCWLALRTPPQPVANDPELIEPVAKNELGNDLFAHTSAIYVTIAGKAYFDSSVAQGLLTEMQSDRDAVSKKASFADEQERARVLDVYSDGIAALERHIQQALQ